MFLHLDNNDDKSHSYDLRFLDMAVFFPTADDVLSLDDAPVAVCTKHSINSVKYTSCSLCHTSTFFRK